MDDELYDALRFRRPNLLILYDELAALMGLGDAPHKGSLPLIMC